MTPVEGMRVFYEHFDRDTTWQRDAKRLWGWGLRRKVFSRNYGDGYAWHVLMPSIWDRIWRWIRG